MLDNLDSPIIAENFALIDAFKDECLIEFHLQNVRLINGYNDHDTPDPESIVAQEFLGAKETSGVQKRSSEADFA